MRLLLLWRLWARWTTRLRVVHESTAGAFWLVQSIASSGDGSEYDRAVDDAPITVVKLGKADRLMHESRADVDFFVAPPDRAVGADAAVARHG